MMVSFGAGAAMAGDATVGKKVFVDNACFGCHGEGGLSQVDTYPVLAGRSFEFLTSALTKFRSQKRINATMNAMASGLSDSDIVNVAASLSTQSGPVKAEAPSSPASNDK